MAKKDYVRKDLAGRWFNAKYPPDFKTNGDKYDGYKTGNEEVLFYDFAVLGYDMAFSYKGKRYYFCQIQSTLHSQTKVSQKNMNALIMVMLL